MPFFIRHRVTIRNEMEYISPHPPSEAKGGFAECKTSGFAAGVRAGVTPEFFSPSLCHLAFAAASYAERERFLFA